MIRSRTSGASILHRFVERENHSARVSPASFGRNECRDIGLCDVFRAPQPLRESDRCNSRGLSGVRGDCRSIRSAKDGYDTIYRSPCESRSRRGNTVLRISGGRVKGSRRRSTDSRERLHDDSLDHREPKASSRSSQTPRGRAYAVSKMWRIISSSAATSTPWRSPETRIPRAALGLPQVRNELRHCVAPNPWGVRRIEESRSRQDAAHRCDLDRDRRLEIRRTGRPELVSQRESSNARYTQRSP
jgi:hypothetical protein